jgi:hypothetical protein
MIGGREEDRYLPYDDMLIPPTGNSQMTKWKNPLIYPLSPKETAR